MKAVKIVITSIVCAVLALVMVGLPAGVTTSAFANGTLTSPLPPPSGKTCRARATVNIRRSPSARARVVGRLPRNSVFNVTGRRGGWVRGSSNAGSGWILGGVLRCTK